MKIKHLVNKVQEITISGREIYAFSFLVYFVISFLRTSTYTATISSNFLARCTYILVLLLLLKIYFFDYQNVKSFLINSLVIIFGIIVWRKAHAVDFLVYLLLILGARGIDFRTIVNWYLKIGIIMLVFMFISSSLGIIKDLVFYRAGFYRHSFGILYPTDFAAHTFYLLLAYCYLNFKKLNWWRYSIFILIAILLMITTQARLDIILIVLMIPLMVIAQRAYDGKPFSMILASFYWFIAPLLGYITVIAGYFYDHSRLYHLADRAVSGRLELSHKAFKMYGVHLFGSHVIEHGFGGNQGAKNFKAFGMDKHYFFIDSSFVRLLIIYGLIAFVLVLVIMSMLGYYSVKCHDFIFATVMVMVALSSVIEQHFLDISYEPFLIALLAKNVFYDNHLDNNSGV